MKRAQQAKNIFFVSPLGNDRWSGKYPDPNSDRTDGPFAGPVRAITGWRLMDDKTPQVFSPARGKVWVADISKDWHSWSTGRLASSQRSLIVPKKDLKGLGACKNADLTRLTTPYTFWANAVVPVARIDEAKGQIGFAAMWVRRPEALKEIPYRIENLLLGIRREGQWYVDSRAGKVYLWSPGSSDPNNAAVTAPYLCEAISLRGDDDTEQRVHNVILRGIHIAHTNLSPFRPGPAQSAFDPRDAAVHLSGVEDCRIEGCRIVNASGTALNAIGHFRRIEIKGCELADCGGGGIAVSGGPATPESPSSNNRILDNSIHHCGSLFWHSVGISTGMSEKTLISHNHIHHMPYAGIMTGGLRHRQFANWPRVNRDLESIWERHGDGNPPGVASVKKLVPGRNRIEGNLIHDVMAVLDDGSAIYCHAGHHNRVRFNVVHHAGGNGSHGLYFDDEEMDSLMEGNIVYDCPINIHAKRGSALHLHNNARHTVRNNVFVGGNRLFTFPNSYGGHKNTHNVFVFGDGYAIPVTPEPIRGPGDGRRQPDWDAGPSQMDQNLYWSRVGKQPAAEFLSWWQPHGFGSGSAVADPLFVDPKNDNYQLKSGSPAFALGFKPVKPKAVGPRSKHTGSS